MFKLSAAYLSAAGCRLPSMCVPFDFTPPGIFRKPVLSVACIDDAATLINSPVNSASTSPCFTFSPRKSPVPSSCVCLRYVIRIRRFSPFHCTSWERIGTRSQRFPWNMIMRHCSARDTDPTSSSSLTPESTASNSITSFSSAAAAAIAAAALRVDRDRRPTTTALPHTCFLLLSLPLRPAPAPSSRPPLRPPSLPGLG